ncbi:MAG: serine/threonine-protein kinase, partial [Planctomycetia bacterium]
MSEEKTSATPVPPHQPAAGARAGGDKKESFHPTKTVVDQSMLESPIGSASTGPTSDVHRGGPPSGIQQSGAPSSGASSRSSAVRSATAAAGGRFARLAVASRLVTVEQILQVLAQLPSELRGSDEVLARALIRQDSMTRWQAEKIWAGRTNGFFVGQYKILGVLGEGGMGKVYRARHTFMNRQVALKILPPKKLKNSRAAARFLREVQAAAQMEHPNIVTVHDAGQQDNIVYMAMELVEGHNLAQHVAEHGPMDPATAADVVAQAAEGLNYAHKRGMVHRDIKPQNLMLNHSGQVKVLDLGVVRLKEEAEPLASTAAAPTDAMLTDADTICGTVAYISPEQARDAHAVDIRSDIYSLGCSFYFLLTG